MTSERAIGAQQWEGEGGEREGKRGLTLTASFGVPGSASDRRGIWVVVLLSFVGGGVGVISGILD